ncbi:hypothetical protein, partial [Acetomicrobium sp. S15 = DSM 107314]|uniref:hypothetical protein n=1 Tax=Acetomicrobium sp. S15 = DSM 107314 TaxID=2529858 RepID=UPI001E3AF6BD
AWHLEDMEPEAEVDVLAFVRYRGLSSIETYQSSEHWDSNEVDLLRVNSFGPQKDSKASLLCAPLRAHFSSMRLTLCSKAALSSWKFQMSGLSSIKDWSALRA